MCDPKVPLIFKMSFVIEFFFNIDDFQFFYLKDLLISKQTNTVIRPYIVIYSNIFSLVILFSLILMN